MPDFPTAPISHAEAYARALLLVEWPLVDVRTMDLKPADALSVRLESLGQGDERTYRQAAGRLIESPPGLLDNIDWLCDVMFELRDGLPILAPGLLPRRLARMIDPDALVCLHPELCRPPEERFDWGSVPVRHDHATASLLSETSVDTHIHLGGALPPVFYWIPLLGGELTFDVLRVLPSLGRGHADVDTWLRAFNESLWLRAHLLCRLVHGDRSLEIGFPPLPPREHPLWKPFAATRPARKSCLEHRSDVLSLGQAIRSRPNRVQPWPFWDPLRDTGLPGPRPHYAAGERRLLYALGQRLRRPGDAGDLADLALKLEHYLRRRNAFHQVLVHDRGSDGLMRFVETFGKRGFLFGRRVSRASQRRRRRRRRQVLRLEKSRMTAALDEQLVDAFPAPLPRPSRHPIRRLEMRVSPPDGTLLLPTLRAWIEGIRDHLVADGGRQSQVGLIVHFIKRGNRPLDAARAEDAARRVGNVLRNYPGLRPWILGFDAAGDERQSSPRLFIGAFRHLQHLQASFRAPPSEPPIELGYTFHVGEDVNDLLTGLRHIDESVRLLLPDHGGRLGHALALGEDPRRFYERRGGQTEPDLGTHILDLLWVMNRWLDDRSLSRQASSALEQSTMGKAAGGEIAASRPWLDARLQDLLGLPFDRIREVCGRLRQERAVAAVRDDEWLAALGVRAALDRPLTLQANRRWIEWVGQIQQALRHDLAQRQLCLEANPTSNLLIGGYLDYTELPYERLVDAELAVSFNTDDPGLFMTSLSGELAAYYRAHAREAEPRQPIANWLEDRLFDAEQSTFLGPRTPTGPDALRDRRQVDRCFDFRP